MMETMNKRNINITCLEDLEREERRVIRRIKKQEVELASRMKRLPEEVITVGVIKVVTGVLEGGALRSLMNIIKKIGKSIFSALTKDQD